MKKFKYFYPYVIRGLIVYLILNSFFLGALSEDGEELLSAFPYWNFFLLTFFLIKFRRIIFANYYNNKFEWVSEEKLSASELIDSFDSVNRRIIHNRLYDKTKNIQEAYLIDKQSENPFMVEIDRLSLLKGKKGIYPKKQAVGYQKEFNTIMFPEIYENSYGDETGIPTTSTDVAVVFFENGWDQYEQPNELIRLFDSELCELVMRTEHQIQKFISLPAKISYVQNNSKGEYVFELKLSRDELIKELTRIKNNPELSFGKT